LGIPGLCEDIKSFCKIIKKKMLKIIKIGEKLANLFRLEGRGGEKRVLEKQKHRINGK
jgi:hypothetical protein